LLALYAILDSIFDPARASDCRETFFGEGRRANMGCAVVVLTADKVPYFTLGGGGRKVEVPAGARRAEDVLDTELLNIAGA
jgi:hypothetical protein